MRKNRALDWATDELPLVKKKKERSRQAQAKKDSRPSKDWQTSTDYFIECVRKYGCNERGDPIKIGSWYEEYLRLIADFRVSRVFTSGCAQLGKAQPLDAKVLTPTGWVLMGEIKPGDTVISGDGTWTTVLQVFPQGAKDVYRVVMDDGSSTECCDEHLWLTQTASDRQVNRSHSELKPHGKRQRDWMPLSDGSRPGNVKTLKEIRETLVVCDKDGSPRIKSSSQSTKSNHTVPVVNPVYFKECELPLDPYLMGVLIGDGCFSGTESVSFSTADSEILDNVTRVLPSNISIVKRNNSKYDYCLRTNLKGYHRRNKDAHPVLSALRMLGLMGHKADKKFIPSIYKFANTESRESLLQGLLDTDGYVSKDGTIQFNSSSYQLIVDFKELALSLGGVVSEIQSRIPPYTYNGEKRSGAIAYRLTVRFTDKIKPFRLPRKLERVQVRELRRHKRYIRDVVYSGKKECQCILVDHPSHLYVTDDYIVTHNTLGHTLLLCYCLTELGMNTLWSYDQERSLNIQVKSNFRPVINGWLQKKGQKPAREDSQSNNLYQVNNVTSQFTYVSTSKMGGSTGTAAAGGNTVGVSRDVLFKEERSQYPPGASDPLNRRLDAGRIPTRPIRELGTPGSSAGIEAEIKKCDRQFYPHYKCPHCGTVAPLHPKGCLLRPVEFMKEGKIVTRYLTEQGKPIDGGWFHKNPEDPIGSAYIGCSSCGEELPKETIQSAWYQCTRTQQKLTDFIKELPEGVPDRVWSCGIEISPLLREDKTTASRIIQEGKDTVNTADWQQQSLGIESTVGSNLLFNLDYVKACAVGQWMPAIADRRYLVCIDPNFGGSDFWVTQVWDITEKPYSLVAEYRKQGTSVTSSEAETALLIRAYDPVLVAVEDNSGGAIVAEDLIQALPSYRIETVTTTTKSKKVNTDRIAFAVEHGEVIYPADWAFCSTWIDNTGKLQPSEASQFARDEREAIAGHDDTVTAWAAGWAWLEEALVAVKSGEFKGGLATVVQRKSRFRQ